MNAILERRKQLGLFWPVVLVLIAVLSYKLFVSGFMNFKVVFLSIIIEALPFIIIGVFVSALLNTFVSDEVISRLFPGNRYLGLLLACFLGIIFPICECGIVPVARRLINKGVPLSSAVTFMLAAPIINPVVISSTAVAFYNNHSMLWLRMGLAFLVAYLAGLFLSFAVEGNQLNGAQPDSSTAIPERGNGSGALCGASISPASGAAFFLSGNQAPGGMQDDQGPGCSLDRARAPSKSMAKVSATLLDAGNEFFEMGKYLVIGAFLGALAQTFIPRQSLLVIGHRPFLSVVVMIVFAFGVSVCSSADAFIAASFAASFSSGALAAFMVFGPMLDVKNTLMLLKAFKTRFVILLIVVILVLVAEGAFLINVL